MVRWVDRIMSMKRRTFLRSSGAAALSAVALPRAAMAAPSPAARPLVKDPDGRVIELFQRQTKQGRPSDIGG